METPLLSPHIVSHLTIRSFAPPSDKNDFCGEKLEIFYMVLVPFAKSILLTMVSLNLKSLAFIDTKFGACMIAAV